uniref:Lipid-binding serum glycoprotein C-terminal domain-containing protein n=1 Tax=Setaria digitata TaxID=48799 RepID=A0A915PIL0_9BILA
MLTCFLLLSAACNYHAVCAHTDKQQSFSTLRTRITSRGLNFFSKFGHRIVDSEIWKITFPQITIPIEDGPGSGEVNVTELALRSFKSPTFSFKLAPPNGITWRSKGGSVKEDAVWLAAYYLIVPIYLSGYVKAKMDDIRVRMQINLLVRDERPQVEVTDCSIDVQQLQVYITGGAVQWIVNLFRTQLATEVQRVIHQKQKPRVTRKFIQVEMVADVTYGQDRCTLVTKPMDDEVDSTNRMAHIWVSEHVPNCLMRTLYINENLTFSITANGSNERVAKIYPNQTTDIFIRLSEAPYVIVNANGIRMFGISSVDLRLSSEQRQSHRLVRLVMNSTIFVIPAVVNRKLVGTVDNVAIVLREHDSTIGHFSPQLLKLLENVLAKAVKLIGESALKIGLPLPLIDNVTVSDDAQITTKDGYVRIDFDFIYE